MSLNFCVAGRSKGQFSLGGYLTTPLVSVLHSVEFYRMMNNLIQEEIKRRLNSGNASSHSVQNFLSSSLLSQNIKIRIYKTTILPSVLYGCETLSLT
jgi:hypothetical protein